tara:strand:+ start:41396 stop:42115 length:720 start_codon:yes stop_codon:yes gene_type:complete
MKLALLTTKTTHHYYFAKQIMKYCDVIDIFIESKNMECSKEEKAEEEHNKFIYKQTKFEKELWFENNFENFSDIKNVNEFLSLSSDDAINEISKKTYDIGIVYGTSKLKEKLIDSINFPIYNLHGGNPEYYRGLDSHLWSVFHNDKKGLVLCLHVLAKDLDAGDIIFQTNIPLEKGMSLHQLRASTTKQCINLTRLLIESIKNKIPLPMRSQSKKGRYYSSMSNDQIIKCEKKFSQWTF